MITSKILVHGVAFLLNFSPNFYTCHCNNQNQDCAIGIRYYNGSYYNVVFLNDAAYRPMSGEVEYLCERIKK